MFKNSLQYRSVKDLCRTISSQHASIGAEYDLVVGIPRSGMIPAYLIGLYLNVPVLDLPSYLKGTDAEGGYRIGRFELNRGDIRVLVVDDSVSTGRQLNKTKEELSHFRPGNKHHYLAVYATPEAIGHVDHFYEEVALPRIFEWNLLNSWIYEFSCVDIDGVLCEDPTEEQNDDGELYRHFLLNAPPKFIPKVPVMSLVTSRLEKYRPETEEWLQKHGIRYSELIMLDLPNKEARVKSGSHAAHKAKAYAANKNAILFIESSKRQAEEIFRTAGRPVFSVEGFEFWPENAERSITKIEDGYTRQVSKKGLHFRIARKLKKIIFPA